MEPLLVKSDSPLAGGPSLADLAEILARRRRWIAACLAVSIAASVAYIVFKAPVFEASAKIRIGQVAGKGLFDAVDLLSSDLLLRYGEIVADGVRRPRPFLDSAMPFKGAQGVVELVSEGNDPEDAAGLLRRVIAETKKRHDEIFERDTNSLSDRLKRIDIQRDALQQQDSELTELIGRLKDANPIQASLVAIERSGLQNSIRELDSQVPILVQMLSPPQTQQTEVLGEVIAPTRPSAPRKMLLLILATALGVVSGVFLALVVEFATQSSIATPRRVP